MMRQWMGGFAVLGCALLALSIAHSKARAQDHGAQFSHRQANDLTVEGPAIHILVTARLPRAELSKLVTDPRTVRDHPDLTAYYRSKAGRLDAEAQRNERLARAFGDRTPLNADSHFSGGRDAFRYHVMAKECLRQAQEASILAALNSQAAQGEGCFTCHSLHGRGGKIGPDLALEGTRDRSDAWLIGHFKDPQAHFPSSVMPSLAGLAKPQLEALATFLQDQKER